MAEPPCRGAVALHTSAGTMGVALFPKESPKACRNMVQMALEGRLDNCPFHRVVPGFVVQTGDVDGRGGRSVFPDKPFFEDEICPRLKFKSRGYVAMANRGEPNTNGSQFFITLAATPELERKNTIFGKVQGTDIFNVLRIAETELREGTDEPVHPPRILRAEVLDNPFDDIVPRPKAETPVEATKARAAPPAKAKLAVARKNLVSFGDGDGDDGGDDDLDLRPKRKVPRRAPPPSEEPAPRHAPPPSQVPESAHAPLPAAAKASAAASSERACYAKEPTPAPRAVTWLLTSGMSSLPSLLFGG